MCPLSLPGTISPAGLELERVDFASLAGFDADDLLAAHATFMLSAHSLTLGLPPTRPARAASAAFHRLCQGACAMPPPQTQAAARRFFQSHFQPWRIKTRHVSADQGNGFLTGYYEPELTGSLTRNADFSAPLLARPDDLVTFMAGCTPETLEPSFSSARLSAAGQWEPYPDRAEIEGSHDRRFQPVVWLRDAAEVFLVQVQGSARVCLPDGHLIRLAYAGRNGHPYTSIGRILIEEGHIPAADMSLARLKHWIRASGQATGEAGRRLMQRNRSYVFFKIETDLAPESGPIGAAGVALVPLRSLAIDRSLWHYGLPFWIEAAMPWRGPQSPPLQRLMIAQDTGSAIVGSARADVFFGTGDDAGTLAGNIRHHGNIHVLLPLDGATT